MVWFSFTFLLGIPNSDTEQSAPKKDENSHVEIEVSKPNFLCHVEYVLVPNQPPKFIDVVCWNQAAKIYFENSTCAIIPFKIENLQWIHFQVNHNVNLELEDIPFFRLHNIKFTIIPGNKKLGDRAKSDKVKKFYGPIFPNPNDSIRQQIFQPLSETLQDLPTVSYLKEHLTSEQRLYVTLETAIETSKYYDELCNAIVDLSREYNDANFLRIPSPPYEEPPPIKNIQHRNTAVETESLKKLKEKKSSQNPIKNEAVEKIEFLLTGEQVLSGKKTFKNNIKYNSKELPFVICYATVKGVLSKAQATFYNPLSIVISTLNDLPVENLKNAGIFKIKFRFFICNNLLAESNLIPIDNRMNINHARTVFTNELDKEELIYFIQMAGLNIELLGSSGKSQPPIKKDQRGTPSSKSTKNPAAAAAVAAAEEKYVVLGKFSADISPILFQPYRIYLTCNFQLSNESSQNENNNGFTSLNEFNSCQRKRGEKSEENANILLQGNVTSPVLSIAVRLSQPLINTWLKVIENPELFKRLVAVFYNEELATPLIQILQDEIDETLGLVDYLKNGTNIRRPLSRYYTESIENEDFKRDTKLTGFIIDCVDKIIIYAEGPVFSKIQTVWAYSSYLNPLEGHVLYDSSLIFLKRLYENLLKFGGFLGITLKEPMHTFLSNPLSYSKQSIPKPAWEALRRISLLADCKSIKEAIKNNFLPDFNSLVSLAIEFGSPIYISCER